MDPKWTPIHPLWTIWTYMDPRWARMGPQVPIGALWGPDHVGAQVAHTGASWTHRVDPKWNPSGIEERPVWAHRRPLGPVWTRGDGPDHMGTCVVPYGRLVGSQGPIMGPEEPR